jgi:glucokinase
MYRIGIDLGGTNIAAGIVNESFEIICKTSIPTGAERPAAEIAADMAAICHTVCEKAGIDPSEIASVGIASPGIANHDDGIIEYCCNIPSFRKFAICDAVKAGFPAPCVFVENDANAAAWGEVVAGSAKGTKDSIMITLGTGVGGGIIIDGKVISGFNYAGAELGHIVIEVDGVQCGCGRKGCWEAYSSATALIRMTKEKLEECEAAGRKTVMTDMVAAAGKVSGRTAFDAKRAGDEAGAEVVAKYVHYLAQGISNIINIFQPEVLSIGGGISGEGQSLVDALMPEIRREVYGQGIVKSPEIRIAQLKNDAGIIGGAVLGLK